MTQLSQFSPTDLAILSALLGIALAEGKSDNEINLLANFSSTDKVSISFSKN